MQYLSSFWNYLCNAFRALWYFSTFRWGKYWEILKDYFPNLLETLKKYGLQLADYVCGLINPAIEALSAAVPDFRSYWPQIDFLSDWVGVANKFIPLTLGWSLLLLLLAFYGVYWTFHFTYKMIDLIWP